MGLLLGSIDRDEAIVNIHGSLILTRRDKKKDRVEIALEDLSIASSIAEQVSFARNMDLKIVGWYHSHPHITVLPSAVDVRTQGQYQALDMGFIGLIFSSFDKGRFDICAFQSMNSNMCWERLEIPIHIISNSQSSYESMLALQCSLMNEEHLLFKKTIEQDSSSVSSATEVYSRRVHKLVDNQMLPLLCAMHSRKRTLEMRKAAILRELQSTAGPSPSSHASHESPKASKEPTDVLSAMSMAFSSWIDLRDALALAFGGFEASGRSVKVIPAQLSTNASIESPWSIEMGGEVYGLIKFQKTSKGGCAEAVVRRRDGERVALELARAPESRLVLLLNDALLLDLTDKRESKI
jgi:BRCA1/BRCA2-containing complex subunit 3